MIVNKNKLTLEGLEVSYTDYTFLSSASTDNDVFYLGSTYHTQKEMKKKGKFQRILL